MTTFGWSDCTRCPLHRTRNCVVEGEFHTESEILVVGEAPGPHENRQGAPFVGPSGQIVREQYLERLGIEDANLTTAIACYPGRIRPPIELELDACSARLDDIIDATDPRLLIAIGKTAEKAIKPHMKGRKAVSVLDPAVLLKQGYPNERTEKRLDSQLLKLKRALRQIGREFDDEAEDETACKHEKVVEGGKWTGGGKIPKTFFVCDACCEIVKEPAA